MRPVHQCPAVNTEGRSGGGGSSSGQCVNNGNNRDAQNPFGQLLKCGFLPQPRLLGMAH